jgi:hypothetical protein
MMIAYFRGTVMNPFTGVGDAEALSVHAQRTEGPR